MHISIITLFPEMFEGVFNHSILKRAQEKKLLSLNLVQLRDFGIGKHQIVDDTPYGGGAGMVIRVDIVDRAITFAKETVRKLDPSTQESEWTILLDAAGTPFEQKKAWDLAAKKHIILVCGHYEGIDERIHGLVDDVLSIGEYVLTGGEIPAMVVSDTVARLVPGVIKDDSKQNESFSTDNTTLVDYPHYTKPQEFNGEIVPDVLLSGNHKEINRWREVEAKKKTAQREKLETD